MRLATDTDCPECGWPETYTEIDDTQEPPALVAGGCSKCGWRIEAAPPSSEGTA